jgi:hypothetical protein
LHAPCGNGKECVCLLKGNKNSILKWLNERMHHIRCAIFVGPTNFQLLLHGFRIVLALSLLKRMTDPQTNKTKTLNSHLILYLGAVNLNCSLREILNGWTGNG